jgi:hypothetical protein
VVILIGQLIIDEIIRVVICQWQGVDPASLCDFNVWLHKPWCNTLM